MKIRIQSKSGDHNSTLNLPNETNLFTALKAIRGHGGYYAHGRDDMEKFIPFEEIEYIEEDKTDA